MKKNTKTSSKLFGTLPDGREVQLFNLYNKNGLTIRITNYGAAIQAILLPDGKGGHVDIVAGYDTLKEYVDDTAFFGATIGRYANRIANGTFVLNNKEYTLAKNSGNHHLHGGMEGFNKKLWSSKTFEVENGCGLQLNLSSLDGEENYPGNLDVTVLYELVGKDLEISYWATTDKPTPVNLTNHSYFNLSGEGTILDHVLELKASHYTPVNDELIPTGEIAAVEGTPFDFTTPKPIGKDIAATNGGYDHNFVIDRESNDSLVWIAKLIDPKSGRILEVFTMEPGVQFYTGNFLDGTLSSGDFTYVKNAGLCLETQHFPDSPNQPDFPSTILEPGDKYYTKTVYRFEYE